jgi:hypothetical protein
MTEETHSDPSGRWLIFFFVCFIVVMTIGGWAIFNYHDSGNAPQVVPVKTGH